MEEHKLYRFNILGRFIAIAAFKENEYECVSKPVNYHSISGLTFISKLIKRLVSRQLTDYLEKNELWPINQSAYRKKSFN